MVVRRLLTQPLGDNTRGAARIALPQDQGLAILVSIEPLRLGGLTPETLPVVGWSVVRFDLPLALCGRDVAASVENFL